MASWGRGERGDLGVHCRQAYGPVAGPLLVKMLANFWILPNQARS